MNRSILRASAIVALLFCLLPGCDDPTLTQGAAQSGCMQTAINSGTVNAGTYETVRAQCAVQSEGK